MIEFKQGDVVQMGGGPRMTVEAEAVGASPWVRCVWFEGSELHRGEFHGQHLVAADAEKAGQDG